MLRAWVLAVALGSPSVAAQSAAHVRSTDRSILDLLREGSTRSATFRDLVVGLEATDVIVYVERGVCAFGRLEACLPHQIAVAGDVRYLRIIVDPSKLTTAQAVVLIGHELQHAYEVATARRVRTPDDLIQLFRRIGTSPHCPAGLRECYETTAARRVGQRIQDDLHEAVLVASVGHQ
jgi:hypothetical protein